MQKLIDFTGLLWTEKIPRVKVIDRAKNKLSYKNNSQYKRNHFNEWSNAQL